jgi:hypothetical protein
MEVNMLGKEWVATIKVNAKLKNANNGQTKHWSGSHKERRLFQDTLASAEVVTKNGVEPLSSFLTTRHWDAGDKAGLVVYRVLGKRERLWDSDSVLRGNYKQLQDSLVEVGLFEDDNPDYIEWVLGLQDKSRRDEGSCVEIEIYI